MSNFELHVERVDRVAIVGWAFDRSKPNRHVHLALYDGNLHLASFYANQYREDLHAAKVGDGDHGFYINLPAHIIENEIIEFRLLDPVTGECHFFSPTFTAQAKFVAAKNLLVEKIPAVLKSYTDASERIRWSEEYLSLMLSGAALAYQEIQLAAAISSVAPKRNQPLNLDGISFDRITAELLNRYPILYVSPERAPKVSVIICVLNKFGYTYECVKSLLYTKNQTTFEIIIVDDFSSDETLMAPLIFQNANVVRNFRNEGFIKSCNKGAEVAKGEYVYFLNNDTLVTDYAIDSLVEIFLTQQDVGLVGSKFLFEDGSLQEAGGIIWRLGDGSNYGRGDDPEHPKYNYVRDVDYISGASILLPSKFFKELGGFDEVYAPAYYEDSDLAFRVRAAGYRTVYQPRSVVYHFEGVSSGTSLEQGIKHYQVVNAKKFFARWKTTLEKHALSGMRPDIEKDRGRSFSVLFVDETTPTPCEDAGSNAAFTHMQVMQKLGGKVSFIPAENLAFLGKPSQALRDAGIEFLHQPYFWSLEEVLRKQAGDFDIIYLHRLNTAVRHLATCRALAPKARIVYNVADLHFLRLERALALSAEPQLNAALVETTRTKELAAAREVDAVIVHSEVEAQLLKEHGVEHVFVVPWTVPSVASERDFQTRSGCMFVGGFGHAPNVDAIEWLMSDIWPLIRSEIAGATLTIVGSHMPSQIARFGGTNGVRCLGFVDDLKPLYDSHRLTIAPLRYGAGLKGKVVQSLAHGIPCIGTPIAYEGFDLTALGALSAETPEEFTAKFVRTYTDKRAWMRARSVALRYANEKFSEAAVTARLTVSLGFIAQ